ncbi:MAG TPA: BON domain-containing protein [Candidatus Dormibacteraeota bacterium]|nr:BON domain-containing protein [Candidatus Dormibacteraeota bacterium]
MKIHKIILMVPVVLAAGCAHRTVYHREVVVSPTSTSPAERVYAPTSERTVVSPSPGEVTPNRDLDTALSIHNTLAADPGLKPALRNVDIEVVNGAVVLRGSVPTEHDRQEMEERIQRFPGVNSVSNLLTVDSR